jgi:hypothetical protein
MEDITILSNGADRWMIQRVLGNYDAPAFIRRALRVREALENLLARCRLERDQQLTMPRLRLGILRALAGDWVRLRPFLANEDQIDLLQKLDMELNPQLRLQIESTASKRKLRRALNEFRESLKNFNRRWLEFLGTVDLAPVNEAREGYNRFYLLEKECALGSPRLARQGFQRLPPLSLNELNSLLPDLPIPETNC